MRISNRLIKTIFYITALGGILFYLIQSNLLIWIIAGVSIIYLVFYFGIATIAVFAVSLAEIGTMYNSLSQKSPLLALVVISPFIFLFWLVLLLFWPLFIIPDRSFVRKPEKYDAIANFEAEVRTKY